MKKTLSILLTLTLLLFTAASALAEENQGTPAEAVVDAAVSLLTKTENVTLNGEATFSLDGVEFKSAKAKVVRDMVDSLWDLKLHTPSRGLPDNDEPIDSGYTIIGNDEKVFVVEVRYPGVYKMGYIFPRTTILRQSAKLDLMAAFARNLALQADTLLGEGAVTVSEGDQGAKEIKIVLDENVPDLVNTALTMAFEYVAERYFLINYDTMNREYMGRVSDYYTVTRGIIYTTEYLTLKSADVTVALDEAGELKGVSGTVSVNLRSPVDNSHQMDVAFSMDVSNRGTSIVETFDPRKENLAPANSYAGLPDNMPEEAAEAEGEPVPEETTEPQGEAE